MCKQQLKASDFTSKYFYLRNSNTQHYNKLFSQACIKLDAVQKLQEVNLFSSCCFPTTHPNMQMVKFYLHLRQTKWIKLILFIWCTSVGYGHHLFSGCQQPKDIRLPILVFRSGWDCGFKLSLLLTFRTVLTRDYGAMALQRDSNNNLLTLVCL